MDMAESHGDCTEFDINIIMKYLLPKARNLSTGQTVKQQDLTGHRFTLEQRNLATAVAEKFANELTARTKEPWVAFLEEYEPSVRRS